MSIAPDATTTNFPDYGNTSWTGDFGDCVEASAAHCIRAIWGAVVPIATVEKVYTKWFPGNGGSVPGKFMIDWWLNGMHGFYPRTFCSIASRPGMSAAAKQKEIQFFLDRKNCGAVMLCVDDGHEIACVGNANGDKTKWRNIWWGVAGYMQDEDPAYVVSRLSQDGHFAISKGLDPLMLLYALKNNWRQWLIWPSLAVFVKWVAIPIVSIIVSAVWASL